MSKKEKNTEQLLEWFNHFVDYVTSMNNNLYNEACEYADSQEEKKPKDDDKEKNTKSASLG